MVLLIALDGVTSGELGLVRAMLPGLGAIWGVVRRSGGTS